MCSVSSRGCCFFYNFLLGVGIGLVLAASGVNRHPSPSSLCCLLTAHFRVSGHSVLFWFGGLGLTIDRLSIYNYSDCSRKEICLYVQIFGWD